MSTEISVAFRDTTLFVVEHRQQPYVPMKPVVEGMGLDWRSQATKLRSNQRWGVVEITTPSEGGPQGASCLPLRKLPGWLASLHPNKVRPEIRETVIAFQNECDDILWDAWQRRMGTPINPESARLVYASKEQREPLVSAVRRLVKVAEAKGRTLTYQDAHSIVNLKLGVSDSEHLTPEENPQALRLVGELWQSVVLEGEYLPRAEPPAPPQETPEYLSPQDETVLSRLCQTLTHRLPTPQSAAHAFWYRLRQVTGVPAPGKFEVRHLPALTAELGRIQAVVEGWDRVQYRAVQKLIKRVLRTGDDPAPILDALEREFTATLRETDERLGQLLQPWQTRELAGLGRGARG